MPSPSDAADPERERVWIAAADGVRLGSVVRVRGDDDHTAKLRLLLVDPAARGLGVDSSPHETWYLDR